MSNRFIARVARIFVLQAIVAALVVLATTAHVGAVLTPAVFTSSGADPAAIQTTVDDFRAAAGTDREDVNWDDVPDASAAPNSLPADYYATTTPRGLTLATAGSGFEVSADASNATSTPIEFGDIDATFPDKFQTFSPERLFTPIGSHVTDVTFTVPGGTARATVTAFGATFTDVDDVAATTLEFFDAAGTSLGVYSGTDAADDGLTFLGVQLTDGQSIARVRITSGNTNLASGVNESQPNTDVVAIDDLIYSEPQPAITVVNTNADGVGSLRQAIVGANALPGQQTISFEIPGTTVHSIQPTQALPTLTDPVILDGYTNDGASKGTSTTTVNAVITIELSGLSAPNGTNGLVFGAGSAGSEVHGLAVNGFNADNGAGGVGILAKNTSNITIRGDFIGTDPTGTQARPNASAGVQVAATAHDVQIGGTAAADRNVVSGNGDAAGPGDGIQLLGRTNHVQGNLVGLTAGGTALGNAGSGVVVKAQGNSIGAGNVIGGNKAGSGVLISGSTAKNNTVSGNIIGGSVTGVAAVPNQHDGVVVDAGASSNTIGGSAASAQNLISGNSGSGIRITASNGNTVSRNLIGTAADGKTLLANGSLQPAAGVRVEAGAQSNVIGGFTSSGNTISGNVGANVQLTGSTTKQNTVAGNRIGLDTTGVGCVFVPAGIPAIAQIGVLVDDGAQQNTIGGPLASKRNFIACNRSHGIELSAAMSNVVQSNYVGADMKGRTGAPNGDETSDIASGGIHIVNGSRQNVIGAAAGVSVTPGSPPGNIISSTFGDGVLIEAGYDDAGHPANIGDTTVRGNYIGPGKSGTTRAGNMVTHSGAGGHGIKIVGVHPAPLTSGTLIEHNVVSGNSSDGIVVTGTTVTDTVTNKVVTLETYSVTITDNLVGTDPSGTAALANQGAGVVFGDDAHNNSVVDSVVSGNTGPGVLSIGERNEVDDSRVGTDATGTKAVPNGGDGIIVNGVGGGVVSSTVSGNTGNGVTVNATGTTFDRTTIWDNRIGTDATGTTAIPNGENGMSITGSKVVIGKPIPGDGIGNLISGNRGAGIEYVGSTVFNDIAAGNLIGTNAAGTAAVPNQRDGIIVRGSAHNVTIGGSNPQLANTIAGNGLSGVIVTDVTTTDVVLQGNRIGVDVSGNTTLGNGTDGVEVVGGAHRVSVGTTGSRNIISGNQRFGVVLSGFGTSQNTIVANRIGASNNGSDAGNEAGGIVVADGAAGNAIGDGSATGANDIAFNHGDGIIISGTAAQIPISRNIITSNWGLGINLESSGAQNVVTPNDTRDKDSGPNGLQNFPVIDSAHTDGTSTTVTVAINAAPNRAYLVEIYRTAVPDPSGFGEGTSYVGSVTLTTDANGDAVGSPSFAGAFKNQYLSGTATRLGPSSNPLETSEFGAGVKVT